MSSAYFLSDVHLKNPQEANARLLRDFLKQLKKNATSGDHEAPSDLFLVGDIFDLWIGDHLFFRVQFHEIINDLQELAACGVAIHFFEGNHDLHLKKFWRDVLGFQVYEGAEQFEIAGRSVRVEHGDQMNPEDRGYLFLRWFLRTPALRWLALHLPSFVVRWIGERASGASRTYTSTTKELPSERIRAIHRRHAENAFAKRPYDILISGHVHVTDDHTFQASGRQVRSVNLGSWYEPPHVFVLDERGGHFEKLPMPE